LGPSMQFGTHVSEMPKMALVHLQDPILDFVLQKCYVAYFFP